METLYVSRKMKFALVILATVALCKAASIVPTVPGDNSHYVEGESRYIWMPDGNGVPHLVDLKESVQDTGNATRNGARNQYWLYTRENPRNYQLLVNGNANSVWSSNFDSRRPLVVTVHGWQSSGSSGINSHIRDAYLNTQDVNIIVLDWSTTAGWGYLTAANSVAGVGQALGDFLVWLVDLTGLPWSQVHLIGHSLGAHLIGNAGRRAGSMPARITGLDPAGPLWGRNWFALKASDGRYVEAIHTDGGLLGIYDQIADVDYYPNGGRNPQPGCSLSTCSHSIVYEHYAATVYFNHLWGNRCQNDAEVRSNSCTGPSFPMGNSNFDKTGSGLHRVNTGAAWPF